MPASILKRFACCLSIAVYIGSLASGQALDNPYAGTTLAKAKLPVRVRQSIEKIVLSDTVVADKYDREDAKGNAVVLRMRIGPEGRRGLRVWGEGFHFCGKSNCTFWIFDPDDGSVLFEGNGYELVFQKTVHEGLYDIRTKHQLGATTTQLDFYAFDGKQYNNIKTQVIGP